MIRRNDPIDEYEGLTRPMLETYARTVRSALACACTLLDHAAIAVDDDQLQAWAKIRREIDVADALVAAAGRIGG